MERQIPDDAVIAVDVGNHAYSFGRYFECKRHTVLMSGYLGSIGFGYPAAMGAWAAAPDRPIVAVTGDGGFAQYMAELTTAVKHDMNITHVLLNNGQLGKISKEQRAGEWEVWQTSLHNPDFSAYARNCGALGIRVTERAAARRGARRGRRPRRPGHGRSDRPTRTSSEPKGNPVTELTDKQTELCERSTTDYSDLKAFFINCTLKRGPEVSHTQGLMDISMEIMRRNGVAVDGIRAIDHTSPPGSGPT